ncbi:MAG: hypothetical protein HUU20_29160 [Pirellulales bacterium]|nr:hypothetical protein [Pirellulales bacterium]
MGFRIFAFAAVLAGTIATRGDAFGQAYAPTGEQAWNYADGIPSLPGRSQWYDPTRTQFSSPQYGVGFGGAAAYSWYSPTNRALNSAGLGETRFIPSMSADAGRASTTAGLYQRQSYRPKFGYNDSNAKTYDRQAYRPKFGYGGGNPYGR